MRDLRLKPSYSSSFALVIGIDKYRAAFELDAAASDATSVADVLVTSFGFPKENVALLVDAEATKARIMSSYFTYSTVTDEDSRLFVFFAGHGFTHTGRSRDVGFLVPSDGTVGDLSTLIRWEELTKGAELIPAKHLFFVMDACYGGLVFNRSAAAGSVRFLKDMLLRPARQALTAGKEDEPVSDGNGPKPKHSIFSGYFLEALEGAARAPEGHLTASAVMSYVHNRVANDVNSDQTPHFGYLEGDGDFIFDAPRLLQISPSSDRDADELVTVASLETVQPTEAEGDAFNLTKQYLSDPTHTIQLGDLITVHVRRLIVETSLERFKVSGAEYSREELEQRLRLYEMLSRDLRRMLSCVSYWGNAERVSLARKAFSRLTDQLDHQSGLVIWDALRWYPSLLCAYSAGIASLAELKYDTFASILSAPVASVETKPSGRTFCGALCDAIRRMEEVHAFKQITGHERFHVPRSEYVYKLLQPELDDDLYLGKQYESLFDQFEVLVALSSAVQRKSEDRVAWGPVGRFGWKYHRLDTNPLAEIIAEATARGADWPPFRAGIFGSDHEFFLNVAAEYASHISRMAMF